MTRWEKRGLGSDADLLHSAIYRGTVRHRRLGRPGHKFSYDVFMMYLDLAELPVVFRGSALWSAGRPAPAWFRPADLMNGTDDLDTAVRELVEVRLGERPDGPIRVLTNLRYFGYLQNPITLFYCFDAEGKRLHSVALEVTNTPWKQREHYVLRCDPGTDRQRITFDKTLHVSPFMPMDQSYLWCGNRPGEQLSVLLENHAAGAKVFDATLSLRREAISPATLRNVLMRYPLMTGKVVLGIYWQAAKLYFIKRVKLHNNPHSTSWKEANHER